MTSLLLIFGSSWGISFLVTPLARALASRCGLVDRPDGRRKKQAVPIPLAGGLAVFLSVTLILGIASIGWGPFREQIREWGISPWGLLLAALVICVVGVSDDLGQLRGRHKLCGQIIAAGIVINSGLVVRTEWLFGFHIDLGLLAMPLTLLWLLATINACNLLDGMDGLLGCAGVTLSVAIAVFALLGGQIVTAGVAVALASALLGFLRCNFPPATVYLGDCGSMLVGLLLGVLALTATAKAPGEVAVVVPLALFTIPFFDTSAAIIRRKLTGRSLYATDRGHLHHCLLRQGFSPRQVLLLVVSCCLLTGLGAMAGFIWNELWAIVAAVGVVVALIRLRLFGYGEFLLIKDWFGRFLVSFLHSPTGVKVHQSEVHLQGSAGWRDLLNGLTDSAHELNLKSVLLDVNAPALHESYYAQWDCLFDKRGEIAHWHTEIPLRVHGQTVGRIEVAGYQDEGSIAAKINRIAEVMEAFEVAVSNSSIPPLRPYHEKSPLPDTT